jgi:hypothetical protein
LARSRAGASRPRAARTASRGSDAGGVGEGRPPAVSLASATLPRVWGGVGYRPLSDIARGRALFDFAAVPWPDISEETFGWGAWTAGDRPPGGERLIGALVVEPSASAMMLNGPVIVTGDDALEVAAQLVAAALDHATALGAATIFTRPHGLDRIWIRFGFIPVPESALPPGLAGRPGGGLYAWRGGSALWTPREAVTG